MGFQMMKAEKSWPPWVRLLILTTTLRSLNAGSSSTTPGGRFIPRRRMRGRGRRKRRRKITRKRTLAGVAPPSGVNDDIRDGRDLLGSFCMSALSQFVTALCSKPQAK
jgi:hypothetical protein